MSREAMKQALEALENVRRYDRDNLYGLDEDITALRAALEKPEPEHTLSCGCKSKYFGIQAEWDTTDREGNPAVAYGAICERHWHELDARHPWIGLTDFEKTYICSTHILLKPLYHDNINNHTVVGYVVDRDALVNAIEAKLKEKNT